jgi:hypothetical protein
MTVILPTPHEPLVDKDGNINDIWYRYLSESNIETNASISGRAKAWGFITSAQTTTPVLSASYNASVVSTVATVLTVTLPTPFSSTNYAVHVTPHSAVVSTGDGPIEVLTGQTSASFILQSSGYTAISFACFGEQ